MTFDSVGEITQEWLDCYEDAKAKNDLRSIFFRLSLQVLPVGVDGDDPRVVAALADIKKAVGEE